MSTGFRVQGAPTTIQSNVVGAGLIEGDQIGDQLPGVLASLQESPEASKTSSLYYNESVGMFQQPSYQRSFGSLNLPVPVNKFGDSASIEVNNDIYWRGPSMLSTTFTIPYAYYGPVAFRPTGGSFDSVNATSGNIYANYSNFAGTTWNLQLAGSVTCRPRIFYSWGAAYANLRQIRMSMGGAMSYVLDHYSNFVGVMASCVSLIQRAALMRAAGCGVMIPDYINEHKFGLTHEPAEIGSIPLFSADGGFLNPNNSNTSNSAYGQGVNPQTGPSSVAGPVIEHWLAVVKTPHTNFTSMFQMRRPIDTRLFSSNFIIDYFTNNALDTFIDTGTGYQPLVYKQALNPTDVVPTPYQGLYIPNAAQYCVWKTTDGLYPCMLYRQLQIPNYANLVGTADVSGSGSSTMIGLVNADVSPINSSFGSAVATSTAQNFRTAQYTSYKTIATSPGYANTYGGNPLSQPGSSYLTPDNFPVPQYNSVISALRLANDQLGAKKVLETRPDLCVLYPFQHFTSQTYRVTQITTATGIIPYNPNVQLTANQLTPFVNTTAGGSGYGGLSEQNCKNFGSAPRSYQNPLFVAISIPNNPLTCLYIMVMREKDRTALGYSTTNQYSPVLYWNALELQAFNLSYSAQVLQKFNSLDEYLISQLHERVEPLIVPFRGGPVCRRDLPLNNPDLIQSSSGFPGAWYNSYIYELCMVDQIPLKNEAFLQQTPSFRGELLNFNFWIKPSLRPWSASDYDFRSVTGLDPSVTFNSSFAPGTDTATCTTAQWYQYVERLAAWCPGIPQTAVGETQCMNWNLNNDNLMVVCVFAQNGLWQLNPLNSKIIFARGA